MRDERQAAIEPLIVAMDKLNAARDTYEEVSDLVWMEGSDAVTAIVEAVDEVYAYGGAQEEARKLIDRWVRTGKVTP